MSCDSKTGIVIKTEPVDEETSNKDSKAGIAIKTEYVGEGTSNEDKYDSKAGIAIKTESTDEKSSSRCHISTFSEIPGEYVKTPAWFCKLHNIDAADTLMKRTLVNTDRGPMYLCSTIGRATFKDVDKEMLAGIPQITKEELEKEDYIVQAFTAGKDVSWMLMRPAIRKQLPVKQIKMVRTMTRQTKEREERKRKIKEKEKEERAKKVTKKVEKPISFVFKCAYCDLEWNRLAALKSHIFGIRSKRFLKITCRGRLEKDGLLALYNEHEIPRDIPPPKNPIWAKVVCKDPKLIDSNGKFTIPYDIAEEWAKCFKEIPL